MFSAIRRAWRAYVDSIPKPDEPERISDEQIAREHFRLPPVDRKHRAAFDALSELVVAHLPAELAESKKKQLRAKLKPGKTPGEALSAWIHASCGRTPPIGVMELDWKAREEVEWQAKLLAEAHRVELAWHYDASADTEWTNDQSRGEAPVDAPLNALARELSRVELVLCRFGVDDAVYAFAVQRASAASVLECCAALGIELKGGA